MLIIQIIFYLCLGACLGIISVGLFQNKLFEKIEQLKSENCKLRVKNEILKWSPDFIIGTTILLENVNRVEVIDQNGRSYVNRKSTNKTEVSLQDRGRTLKIFITKKNNDTL